MSTIARSLWIAVRSCSIGAPRLAPRLSSTSAGIWSATVARSVAAEDRANEVTAPLLKQMLAARGDAGVPPLDTLAVQRNGALFDEPRSLAGGRRQPHPHQQPRQP